MVWRQVLRILENILELELERPVLIERSPPLEQFAFLEHFEREVLVEL